MANVKISNLTAATTPVAGTEVLPIVQSGATVKVSIANLTPGLDTITAAKGGTGQTSYAVGDLLYASTTTALSKLADVATGNALISGGVSTAPSWGKIGLTTHVSGVLPTANGGTNLSSFTANGVVYASSTSALTTGSALVFDGTNLGVGTVSPTSKLHVTGDARIADTYSLLMGSGAEQKIFAAGSANSTYLTFNQWTGSAYTERMRIDGSGNLGLGVTPSAWAAGWKVLQFANGTTVGSGSSTYAAFAQNYYYNGTNNIYLTTNPATLYAQSSGQHQWFNAPSGTAGTNVTLTQAMTLDASGNLRVGTTTDLSAGDKFTVVGGNIAVQRTSGITSFIGDNTQNGYTGTITNHAFAFLTNSTERARIDSSGNLLVGKTALNLAVGTSIDANTSTGSGVRVVSSATTASADGFQMYSTGTSTYRFAVSFNGTISAVSTVISSISDARLKENVRDLNVGLSEIMALKPRLYDWKEGKGADIKNARGFIAQEFEIVFPDLIDESRDPAPEGEGPYKAVRADLIPVLVKAIQEQQALIQTLTARITALESA